jgi:hypothetical protein
LYADFDNTAVVECPPTEYKWDVATSPPADDASTFAASSLANAIHDGTFIENFTETCEVVIAANDFYGSCCSFSDIDEDGKQGCQLTVAGEGSGCGWNNKKYLEGCADNGGCLAGPYVTVSYANFNNTAVAECPPTEYQWDVSTSLSADDASTASVTELSNLSSALSDDVYSGCIPSSWFFTVGWFSLGLLSTVI